MNYKLEKFWNFVGDNLIRINMKWTINLKSFEIFNGEMNVTSVFLWTINLKSFEIIDEDDLKLGDIKWTINLKSFEIKFNWLFCIMCIFMNYKLEKFWNFPYIFSRSLDGSMNYKLEKFWNFTSLSLNFLNSFNEL